MFYHLNDHIYLTQFRDEFILLDLKKDKYTICLQQFSELLINLLEKKKSDLGKPIPNSSNAQFLQDSNKIQQLIAGYILKEEDTPYPFYIDRKCDSTGVANIDWRLALKNMNVPLNTPILNALAILIQVNFYIKVRGFYSTIQLIKKSLLNQSDYIIPQEEELRNLANIVNKACLIYPTRTKCLEWAITYVLLALKRKWRCNLEIGVQNYPFFAHAWVECNERVVMDSQNLRKGLAIILNEPFRKLKI